MQHPNTHHITRDTALPVPPQPTNPYFFTSATITILTRLSSPRIISQTTLSWRSAHILKLRTPRSPREDRAMRMLSREPRYGSSAGLNEMLLPKGALDNGRAERCFLASRLELGIIVVRRATRSPNRGDPCHSGSTVRRDELLRVMSACMRERVRACA